MTSYIGEIVQDEKGDLILTFPPELLNELDWAIGDVLEWIDNKDGTFSVKKIKNE